MPDYPKTTGELVTVKDPADNKTKLLDTLIQLLRNVDASTLETLENLATTVSNLSGQAWKNNQTNLPTTNNAYDIGKYVGAADETELAQNRMIRHIYSMGMTLGREGYEWEINDTDGYVTLPSGMLIQWGTILRTTESGVYAWYSLELPIAFADINWKFAYIHVLNIAQEASCILKRNTITKRTAQIRILTHADIIWFALGKI